MRRLQGGSREILPTQRLCSIGTKRVRHAMVYCQSLIDCTRDRYHERFLSTCNFPTNTLHSSLLDKLQRNLDEILEFFEETDQGKLLERWRRQISIDMRHVRDPRPTTYDEDTGELLAVPGLAPQEELIRDNQLEQRKLEEIFHSGLVLLRCMSRQEFAAYDLVGVPDVAEASEGVIDSELENGQMKRDTKTDETWAASIDDSYRIMNIPNLDIESFNVTLLCMALDTNMSREEILESLMIALQQMNQLVDAGADSLQLDATTYEIILHALNKRVLAFKTGNDLVKELLDKQVDWNRHSLMAAVQLCDKRNNMELALRLVTQVSAMEGRSFKIPASVYNLIIKMAKKDGLVDGAMAAVRLCLKEYAVYRMDSQHDADSVLINAVQWLDRDRSGRSIDTTASIEKLLGLIDEWPSYKPGFKVWKEIIAASAKGAPSNHRRWQLVQTAFRALAADVPGYWPDHRLLLHGIEACHVLNDVSLAADLIHRIANNAPGSIAKADDDERYSSDQRYQSTDLFSVFDLERIVNICLNDSHALRSVMEDIFDLGDRIPLPFRQRLFELGVKGYAANNEPDTAEALLLALCDGGLELGEDAFGAVLHSFVLNKQPDRALQMFHAMESGELTSRPGASSYNGLILAKILAHDWSAAVELYSAMIEVGVTPLPATNHSALLATYRLGGKVKALSFLEGLISSHAHLTISTCNLAAKIALDLAERTETLTSDVLRDRVIEANEAEMKNYLRTIMGSWRLAENQQAIHEHGATAAFTPIELEEQRRKAWDVFLKNLIQYSKQFS